LDKMTGISQSAPVSMTGKPAGWFSRGKRFLQDQEGSWLALAAALVFLVIWELIVDLGWVKPLFISSPSRIFQAGLWLFGHGLWKDIGISAGEFALGLSMAVVVGIPMGIALGWYHYLYNSLDLFISALNATPRVALLPLIILWLGIGVKSTVALVFLGALFPVLINVTTGVRSIDDTLVRCARSFGANEGQVFLTIALPGSIPFIIAGLRLAVGRALVGIVVGEMVASNAGIGHMITLAGASFQTDRVFVGILLIATFGYLLSSLLQRLETRFDAWRGKVRTLSRSKS
jgi:ABC-type nitrate/sulfonate/bicarbonate transport system permease component